MNDILISIIIPIFNSQASLDKCLFSVREQTCKKIEIVCVDDGSTDDSISVIRAHQRDDSRIKIIQKKNEGAAFARNAGIRASNGEYIGFIDSDDYYPNKNVLSLLLEKAFINKADICGGSLEKIKNGHIYKKDDEFDHFTEEGWIDFYDYQWDYGFYRYIYRRDFLTENRLQFPNLSVYEDPPFLLDCMLKCRKFYAIKENTYTYRLDTKEKTKWGIAKTNSLADGLLYCMKKSKECGCESLLKTCINRMNGEYLYVLLSSLEEGNHKLFQKIKKAEEEYGCEIESIQIFEGKKEKIIKEKQNSSSLIRGILESINENGISYTIKRVLFHLGLAKDNDPARTIVKGRIKNK